MDRILKAFDSLKNAYTPVPNLLLMRSYVETGDPSAIKRITPQGRTGSYWGYTLTGVLTRPAQWTDADRRVIHLLHSATLHDYLWRWIDGEIATEKPVEDVFAIIRKELEIAGETMDGMAQNVLNYVSHYVANGQSTSVGRFLLSFRDDKLKHLLKSATTSQVTHSCAGVGPMADLLTLLTPERLPAVVDDLLMPGGTTKPSVAVFKPLLDRAGSKYLPNILAAFKRGTDTWNKFHLGQTLYNFDRKQFADLALQAARDSLAGPPGNNNHGPVGVWMVQEYGAEVLPDLVAWFKNEFRNAHWGNSMLDAAVATLRAGAVPVLLAALDGTSGAAKILASPDAAKSYGAISRFGQAASLRQRALEHLIAMKDPTHEARIEEELRRSVGEPDPGNVVNFLNIITRWKPQRLDKEIWGLLEHKSKPVRSAAAKALAKTGDAALPRAKELLGSKKADVRQAAVTMLGAMNLDAALTELENRLDEESNDDVRDQMLLALSAAWQARGRQIVRKDVEARIALAAGKLGKPPAKWIDISKLSPLYWTDGQKLARDAVAYLLYRQSRAKEIRPDVEVAPMYNLLDRKRSGDFAKAILQGFLASDQDAGDRWALTVSAMLGSDTLVPELTSQIREWVDKNRGKLAEYAVQSLALLGTDVALLAVDAMAIRYRSKMKNVGLAAAEAFIEAAEKQGVTPDELGDRVVPWLGFEAGKPRIVDAGGSKIEASIGMDFKVSFKDLAKNKAVKSLPKTALKQVLEDFKDLNVNLREVVKAQTLRLENLLVRQRRWPAEQWKSLFLQHPLLLPFAGRLVWGHYQEGKPTETFRALPDRTLTTNQDDAFELSDKGTVGMIHPMELSDEQRTVWQNHLADYEIEPPFPQLERQVVRCSDDLAGLRTYRELRGTAINGMTFKGRAERLGWYRGSVCDGGGITSYHKTFPSSGADVFLGVEDMYIGIDMYSEIKLSDVQFVKHGSVKVGSYTYDEPHEEKDSRIIPLGQVPPIVYSEVMGDLEKIAGKKEGQPAEDKA